MVIFFHKKKFLMVNNIAHWVETASWKANGILFGSGTGAVLAVSNLSWTKTTFEVQFL